MLPFDFMGIQQQLVSPRLGIVKYGHFAISDDYEFLLLVGMEAGDNNVRTEP